MRGKKIIVLFIFTFLFLLSTLSAPVWAWKNGGYTDPDNNPKFGTHDWIALQATNWLPEEERWWILKSLDQYLLGNELPDNAGHPLGIGDTALHHVYYDSSESLTDDSSAVRALTEYDLALGFLNEGDYSAAALHAGIMSHYIVDVGVFGHVMGSGTDWGAEVHHSDYEDRVETRTDEYPTDTFSTYISYDGTLSEIDAYDASLDIAYDTTFDTDGTLTCVWMDANYDWNNQIFVDRAGESVNLCVNTLADVLHTLYSNMVPDATLACFDALFRYKPENTVYFVPTGNIYDDSTLYAFYSYRENPQIIAPPTQKLASDAYVDADGKPLFTGNIITFGGRFANRMVRYYEDSESALVGYAWSGTHHLFVRISDGSTLYAVEGSTYDAAEKDYFVFQVYRDGARYILSEWGICAEGTYAGGVCFIDEILPNIQNLKNQYYIYSWTDLNDDDMPQQNEISQLTSG